METSTVIYLDTHVIVWLYAEKGNRLSETARRLIEESQSILISPIVMLELDFIYISVFFFCKRNGFYLSFSICVNLRNLRMKLII